MAAVALTGRALGAEPAIAACTADSVAAWDFTHTHTLGIAARDPVSAQIGTFPAKRRWVGRNWFPIDGYKHTLCGTLHKFYIWAPGGLIGLITGKDEADWNNEIVPDPPFRYLIDDLQNVYPKTKQWYECGDAPCLEAEITPPAPYFRNPWFPAGDKAAEASPLTGRKLCAYGPWIYEQVHDSHPEIHPSEFYWWREPFADGALYHMLVLQDDSQRFDKPSDFVLPDRGAIPTWWKPWGQAPRAAEFRLAFQVDPTQTRHLHVFVSEAENFSRYVATSDTAAVEGDRGDNSVHTFALDGRTLVTVEERQLPHRDLDVRIMDVCRRGDGTLQGYVTLSTVVGADKQDKRALQGYQTLVAAIFDRPQPVTDFAGFPAVVGRPVSALATSLVPGSLRSIAVDGQRRLTAAFDLGRDAAVPSGAAQPRTLTLGALKNDAGGEDRKVLALLDHDADAAARTGAATALDVAPVVPQPTLSEQIPPGALKKLLRQDTKWSQLLGASGVALAPEGLPAGLALLSAGETHLGLAPSYGAMRPKDLVGGDDSPISEELNEALRGNDKVRLREIFGAEQPFKVTWSFAGLDVLSGKSVPVRVDAPRGPNEIGVTFAGERGQDLAVVFPLSAGGVYELVANAEVTDSFGATGAVQRRVWSHYLTGDDEAQLSSALVSLAATASGVSLSELVAAAAESELADSSALARDAPRRFARLTHVFARRAADDKQVSIDELKGIVGLARRYRAAQNRAASEAGPADRPGTTRR